MVNNWQNLVNVVKERPLAQFFAWLNLKAEVDEVMLTKVSYSLVRSTFKEKNQRDLEVVIHDIMKED